MGSWYFRFKVHHAESVFNASVGFYFHFSATFQVMVSVCSCGETRACFKDPRTPHQGRRWVGELRQSGWVGQGFLADPPPLGCLHTGAEDAGRKKLAFL